MLDDLDVVDTRKQEVTKPGNRKRSSHRKSDTQLNLRQSRTLERLHLFSELKVNKKWLAEERGVSKSLVVKWNKNSNLSATSES